MTRQGLKDKEGYDALITLIDMVSRESNPQALLDILTYVLYRFIDIRGWLINSLVIIGVRGRRIFQDKMISHLSDKSVPKALKVAWNEEIERITSI
ncbi:hypothetical protein [Methanocella conradii]|nr:hypothetical protein [Methanocella conradii]MDI6897677.1 hypothetical protein [Methanocella conradii]